MVIEPLATQTVNTNINWLGLIVSLASFIGTMAGILTYIDRKQDKRNQLLNDGQTQLRAEFAQALDNAAKLLSERLETKDNVNQLKIEVAKLTEQLRALTAAQHGNLYLLATRAVVDTERR